jgi:hypothetical protein
MVVVAAAPAGPRPSIKRELNKKEKKKEKIDTRIGVIDVLHVPVLGWLIAYQDCV